VGEELVDDDTGQPFDPGKITLFKTFVDERPGEHNILAVSWTESLIFILRKAKD